MKNALNWSAAVTGVLVLISALAVLSLLQSVARAGDSAEAVKGIYNKKCAVCHGPDGAAKTAKGRKSKTKDVRLPEVQKMPDQKWYEIVVKGKGENMDSFRKELTDDQIHGLVQYMRDLAKQPPKS
jgi:mono/diheme cytochrome c family protein